jgi:hypothetical protein
MKTITVYSYLEVPKNFTGIADFSYGAKCWFKERKYHREDGPAVEWANGYKEWWIEGKRHRTDGPAIEYSNGEKYWYIEDIFYTIHNFQSLFQISIFLGKQKGKYNLDWLRFLTDQGIEEFPIIPGMEEDNNFIPLFSKVFGAPIK